ncbi:MAG: nicotinate-nicotinamide nucleotide adenylyltransferase [Polyangiaceae bacterium]|nr:nicotinate-nicotinamide nucleotide adenylyltransferase [Polyangiaceae bacterium]
MNYSNTSLSGLRVAVFGGSFDPPHRGHVVAVERLLEMETIDRVLVVPVFEHALSKRCSPFSQRLRMCEAAFDFDSRIEVSAIEENLSPPSYTLPTLQALCRLHPAWSLRLVIGTDVLNESHRWHRFEEVQKLAPPIVLSRAGYQGDTLGYETVEGLPELSSSEVRRYYSEGDHSEISAALSPKVRELIAQFRLYSE